MIINVYNMRDEREGTYGTPFFTEKDEVLVMHDYEESVAKLQANIARYQEFAPEEAARVMLNASQLKDCVIYKAGTFDTKTGLIKTEEPVLVCRISDFFREVSHNG